MILGFVIVEICGFSLSGDLARPLDQRFLLLYGWEPLKVIHHPIKFGGNKHCSIGDNGFSLSRDLVRTHDQRIMWLCKYEPINISYHLAKFGGHRVFGRGDMFFLCHVILQDHLIKAFNDFMVRSPSRYITIVPNFVAIYLLVVDQSVATKGSCWFMGGTRLK